MKCLTWNLEWVTAASRRLKDIRALISDVSADVVCYTEVAQDALPNRFAITSDPDYGYPIKSQRRQVMLWSRLPWTDVDAVGEASMPSGRFVSGVTAGVRFVGICIPWAYAHVSTGRKDRKAWEDHLAYCHALGHVLERYSRLAEPVCVLGDFNQRIPRRSQPKRAYAALRDAIPDTFVITTEGLIDGEGKPLIDHIAVSPGLKPELVEIIPRFSPEGTRLSDHVGISATLKRIADTG